MRLVIRGLRAQGHSVSAVLAADQPPSALSASRSWARRVAPLQLRLAGRDLTEFLHDLSLDRRVMEVCRELDPEVIYERTDIYHTVGARTARRLNLPLVLEVNGPLVEERVAWGGLFSPACARHLESAKYAAADAIVTVSAALSGYLAAQGVDPAKIHAVPNGVDPSVFDAGRAHAGAIRTKFGLGRRLVIGFVGAFADWHRLETLITAAGEIVRGGALDLHLLMVGDGPSRPRLRELARSAGLEGRAALPGSVPHDQVPHYIAAMDICVLPSANWYMSPIKLFEYGAMGRAVIAPRTPAVCEVMTDGEDGLLITPGSAGEMIQAILRMGRHPEERPAMAAAFQQRVRRRHTWMAVAGRVSQLLEQSLRARQLAEAADRRRIGEEAGTPWNETVEAF
jgi:glycosyltransferase involved in cell wall biosynthesis